MNEDMNTYCRTHAIMRKTEIREGRERERMLGCVGRRKDRNLEIKESKRRKKR